jgi:hypothetical protein
MAWQNHLAARPQALSANANIIRPTIRAWNVIQVKLESSARRKNILLTINHLRGFRKNFERIGFLVT